MIIIDLINWFVSLFSSASLNFSFDSSWLTAIVDIINFVSWVIPIDVIYAGFAISCSTLLIRLIVAIWKLLPLV